jgi:lysosomal Pro-X carboxypeptidase
VLVFRNITSNDAGKAWLSAQWKLCTPLKTQSDVDTLVNWFSEIVVNMAMVNYPYPTSFLAPLPAYPVRSFCYKMTESQTVDDETLLTTIGAALEIYTNYTQTTKCNVINETAAALGEDAWDFQACTEMIMPMCSTDDDMFENSPWDFRHVFGKLLQKVGSETDTPRTPHFGVRRKGDFVR